MKVFVTGGTGFIGKHLVRALVREGNQIRVLVRKKEMLTQVKKLGAEPLLGNLDNIKSLKKNLFGIDVVYHLAAIRSDWGYSWADYYQTNVEGTRNLLTASAGQVKHFIFISSVKAAKPTTLYGKSKLQAEKEAFRFFKKGRVPITIIRPTVVYGPEDSFSGMMPKFIRLIKSGWFLIVGSGENRLHLVYIDDLVQALLLTAKNKGKGEIYTIASEKPIRLKNLVSLIAQEFKVKIFPIKVPIFLAKMAGIIFEKIFKNEPIVTRSKVETITSDVVYNISKARKELGFSPKVDYPEGIKKTIDWFKNQWS